MKEKKLKSDKTPSGGLYIEKYLEYLPGSDRKAYQVHVIAPVNLQ